MKLRITIAGNTYDADVEVLEEDEIAEPYAPPDAPPRVAAPVLITGGNGAPNHDPSDNVCHSPVTGLVIRVHVTPGQAVELGQVLMVLEAMKMETQITAPRAGTVDKVHVAPGDSVKANQSLIELS